MATRQLNDMCSTRRPSFRGRAFRRFSDSIDQSLTRRSSFRGRALRRLSDSEVQALAGPRPIPSGPYKPKQYSGSPLNFIMDGKTRRKPRATPPAVITQSDIDEALLEHGLIPGTPRTSDTHRATSPCLSTPSADTTRSDLAKVGNVIVTQGGPEKHNFVQAMSPCTWSESEFIIQNDLQKVLAEHDIMTQGKPVNDNTPRATSVCTLTPSEAVTHSDIDKVLEEHAFMTQKKPENDNMFRAISPVILTSRVVNSQSDADKVYIGDDIMTQAEVEQYSMPQAISPCTWTPPAAITQTDLDEALSDNIIMPQWESENYTLIKTLAEAASGDGTVELMSSRKEAGALVAVKRLPFHLVMANAADFEMNVLDQSECPWTDIAIVKHLNSFDFPYVCKLLGVYHGNDEVNIVTSFATKGDLISWVDRDTTEKGEEREAAMRPIVFQMFEALCWLHDLGIAHRDLSAENVVLTEGNDGGEQVKIIDFGMATLSHVAKDEVRGKRSYQAPEMHLPEEYDTLLVDNFALGVIIYFMAMHRYPWEHTRPGKCPRFEFARQHGMEVFLRPKRVAMTKTPRFDVFSLPLRELLCGLLQFDPKMRYSLGEERFHTLARVESKLKPSSVESTVSEISTACSTRDVLPDFPGEDEDFNDNVDPAHLMESRPTVWSCGWVEVL